MLAPSYEAPVYIEAPLLNDQQERHDELGVI